MKRDIAADKNESGGTSTPPSLKMVKYDCDTPKSETAFNPLGEEEPSRKFQYFIIHKPREVLSDRIDSQTTLKVIDPKSANFGQRVSGITPRTTVYEVAAKAGFPSDLGLAGRLDYMTSGIMLMSNDSRLLQGVIRPPQEEEVGEETGKSTEDATKRAKMFKYKTKVYEVCCFSDRLYTMTDLDAIAAELSEPFSFSRQGQKHRTSPAQVEVLCRWQCSEHSRGRAELGWSVKLRIELREGKHHQIRRMCSRSKFIVRTLHRVKIASILSIETIPKPGDCRWLTCEEVIELSRGLGLGIEKDDIESVEGDTS